MAALAFNVWRCKGGDISQLVMMTWCSVTFAAVMFADCVAVWAAAAAAAAVLADVTAWNDVVELPAADASAASIAVAVCFAVDLLLRWCMRLSECLLKVLL